jgi:hypothetical protein
MFVGFDRSRWIQELDELDRIIDQNLEQVLEQRRVLASLDVAREADLISEFLEELLSARQIYIADRERLLRGSRCYACGATPPRRSDYISVTLGVRLGLNEAILFRASYRHRH